MYTKPEITGRKQMGKSKSKVKVKDTTVDVVSEEEEQNALREMLASMSEEDRNKLLSEFTPKKVPKRQAEEEAAREYLFDQLPKLKKIMDAPYVPGGFVLELGKDRAGRFFANTRNIRKKRK